MRTNTTGKLSNTSVYRGVRSVFFPREDDRLIKPHQLERNMLLVLLPLLAVACLAVHLFAEMSGVATWFDTYEMPIMVVVFLGLTVLCVRTPAAKVARIRYATLILAPGIVLQRLILGMWWVYRDGYSDYTLGALSVWLVLSASLFVFLVPGRVALLAAFAYYAVTAALVLIFLAVNPHEMPVYIYDDLILGVLVATPTFLMLTAGFTHLRMSYGTAMTMNSDLEEMALHDSLTGLFNRRAFSTFMRRARSRQARKGTPVSMALLDIDHFKRVNDTFGHQKGDEILAQIANILTQTMRRTDDVIRWGGEEFVILMEETPLREASMVADRIREIIQNTEILRERPVTVSIGVTELVLGEDDSEFFGRADSALYDAKDTGRNRVVVRKRNQRTSDPRIRAIAELLESIEDVKDGA